VAFQSILPYVHFQKKDKKDVKVLRKAIDVENQTLQNDYSPETLYKKHSRASRQEDQTPLSLLLKPCQIGDQTKEEHHYFHYIGNQTKEEYCQSHTGSDEVPSIKQNDKY
jgi:hypothetical protein